MGKHNSSLPNFAMIAGSDFLHGSASGPGGLNDGLWCQSAINASENIGSWFYPNGNSIPNDASASPVSTVYSPGQVGLLRKDTLINNEGFYTCTIPDESAVSQVLVVWAAGVAAYSPHPGKRERMGTERYRMS